MTENGCLVEGFWKDNELVGEFMLIKPNGNCFIGQIISGRLRGFTYKYSKIEEIFLSYKEAFEGKKNVDVVKQSVYSFKNYRDDTNITGVGFEVDKPGGNFFKGFYHQSKFKRPKESIWSAE